MLHVVPSKKKQNGRNRFMYRFSKLTYSLAKNVSVLLKSYPKFLSLGWQIMWLVVEAVWSNAQNAPIFLLFDNKSKESKRENYTRVNWKARESQYLLSKTSTRLKLILFL